MASSDPNRSKKGKGRYVPSRYKQSAENYSSLSSEGSTRGPDRFDISRNPRLHSGTLNRTRANPTKKLNSTPEIAGIAPPNFDESSIPNASCIIDSKKDSLKQRTLSNKGCSSQKILSCAPSSRGAGKKSKSNLNQGEVDLDAEMDVSYAQYQLTLLLENRARKSLQEKSKVALEKLYEVFCYVQILLGKHESLKKSLNVVSFLLELNEHLHKQETMLAPALELVDTLEKQYEEIATAVDSVRHKLQVEEVTSTEGSEDEIIQLMSNIDSFLNSILTSVGNVNTVVASADAATSYVEKGKLTSDEIKRCLEQLAKARNLLLSETSLTFSSLL